VTQPHLLIRALTIATSGVVVAAWIGHAAAQQRPEGVADGTVAHAPAPAQTAAPPSADADPNQVEDGRPIDGVEVHVRVWHADGAVARKAIAEALGEIERVLGKLSAERRTSEVTTINRAADREEVIVSNETYRLLEQAIEYCRATGGAYDPTVASFDYLWNFRRRPPVRPLDDEVAARLKLAGCKHIALKPGRIVRIMQRGVRLTLSDLAHGHALDRASRALRLAGVENFRIRVGSDVYVAGRTGTRHWYVAVRHPDDPRRDMVQLYLSSHAAATRHHGERYFIKGGKRYHDVIDPRSGRPRHGVVSATVIATDSVQADALSSAVFVLGPKDGIALLEKTQGVEGFVVDEKGNVRGSSGMSDFARLPEHIDL
jgi:thiamine biosynthesis lipoprotein